MGNTDGSMEIVLRLLNFVGLWDLNLNKKQPWKNILYRVYRDTVTFIYCTFTLMMCNVYFNWGNLDAVFKNTGIILTCIPTWSILFSILIHKTKYQDILCHFDLFSKFCGEDFVLNRTGSVEKISKEVKFVTKVYCMIFGFVASSWLILPTRIFEKLYAIAVYAKENRPVVHSVMPLNMFTIFDMNETNHFAAQYIYQFFGFYLMTYLTAVLDAFYLALVITTYGYFEITNDSLTRLSPRIFEITNNEEHGDIESTSENKNITDPILNSTTKSVEITKKYPKNCEIRYEYPEKKILDSNRFILCNRLELNDSKENPSFYIEEFQLNDELANKMNECLFKLLNFHQHLLRHCEDLRSLLDPVLFVQFLIVSLNLCLIGFELTKLTEFSMAMVMSLGHLCCVLLRLGLLCYYGSKLTYQSVEVGNAVFSSDWYSSSTTFKKSLLMMIMRAQKPVVLTAGRFGVLSLESFMGILQKAYSYFAVLRKVVGE